jgi:hypothetical protein
MRVHRHRLMDQTVRDQTVQDQTVQALILCQSKRTREKWNDLTLGRWLVVVMTLPQDMGGPHTAANTAKLSLRLELFGVEVWTWLGGVETI